MPTMTLKVGSLEVEVRCPKCDTLLDCVPDKRTAYFRAGRYAEHCDDCAATPKSKP